MEEFVSRTEFDNLKKEVEDIKSELKNSSEILQNIDKKITIISERLESSYKMSDLQDENLETRITARIKPIEKDIIKNAEEIIKIQDNAKWIWRTIGASLIGIVIKLVVDISDYLVIVSK